MPDLTLPERASLDYLRKVAKNRLQELRRADPEAKLATALLHVARDYGFPSWRVLKSRLDAKHAKQVASPAMRDLAVADLNRAVAFYRDVLGFEIKEADGGVEAVMGPARIRFGNDGDVQVDRNTPKAPGSAILFLQSADVESLHAAIAARGGNPSAIERVNWIKMRMFEIRDPDQNVIWFGQSYHKHQDSPSRRDGQPAGLRQALPELPVSDVAAAVAWYRDVLGFRINYEQHDLGVMDRDAITVLLRKRSEQPPSVGSFSVYVSDADALYTELTAKGAHALTQPISHPWGLRDFSVVDIDGNRITFAQTFE